MGNIIQTGKKLFLMAVMLLAIVGSATSQTLSIATVEVTDGEQGELVVSASDMSDVTALQFNLSLPEGITLNEDAITMGEAASNHTLSVQALDEEKRLFLFVLYNMDLDLIGNGTLLRLPVTLNADAIEPDALVQVLKGYRSLMGSIQYVRTATTDAVSHDCETKLFYVKIKPAVTLNKSEVIVKKKSSVTLKATVSPEALADKSVTWESSDKSVATVSSSGKVTGVKSGVVTITCTSVATGAKATCKVTVGTITLNKKEVIVRKKKSVTLKPTVYPTTLEDKSVTWKSSDKTIATVSSSGKVTGVKSGVVTITCTSNATGLSTTCKVTVGTITLNKSEVIVKKKKSVTLTPTVYPTSLEDKSVTWKSSDESVATVSSDGVVTGVKSGVITITCTSNATGLSTTCKVTVATIALNKSSATITVGNTLTLKPTVYPTTLEDKSVTWKSSNKSVATVKNGKVTAVAAGTATITCTAVATGVITTCKVTVTASASARALDDEDAELTDIEIVEVTPAVEEPFDVFDLLGHKVRQGVTSLDGLPAGVFIVKGKKVMKK